MCIELCLNLFPDLCDFIICDLMCCDRSSDLTSDLIRCDLHPMTSSVVTSTIT